MVRLGLMAILSIVVLGPLSACGSSAPVARPTTTPTSPPISTPRSVDVSAADPGDSPPDPLNLRIGATGPEVRALQDRLSSLGYWLGSPDGAFGALTHQAVLALQKAAHVTADGIVGPETRRALTAGTSPVPRHDGGSRIEVDLDHQLVLVVSDGKLDRVFNASTGSNRTYTVNGVREVAVTPTGEYSIFRRVDGWDSSPLGTLWRPAYFVGGVALHGHGEVPPYPASHGCVRVSIAAMDWFWAAGLVADGTPVLVY